MIIRSGSSRVAVVLSLLVLADSTSLVQADPKDASAKDRLVHWNEVAMNTTGLDHTPVAPGENRVFGEQFGPTRSSRAMAIVHIAMFDAVNAIDRHYTSYTGLPDAQGDISMDAAIGVAAHDTLVALYPSQTPGLDATLADDLSAIKSGKAKTNGIALGSRAAATILALRNGDGSDRPEPNVGIDFITGNAPGMWRQDPISQSPLALGAYWGQVQPFVLDSSHQFRAPTPHSLTSPAYTLAYNEVRSIGGDGIVTPTMRTAEETQIGIYWAYDGTPTLCAPPRLYNQITMHIAAQMGTDAIPLARSPGAGQCRDGRRGHRDLGIEVFLPVLAAGDRDPRVRPGHGPDGPR